MHPVGKTLVDFILNVDNTGYKEGRDYQVLSDGWSTPYHAMGHLWANLLLEDSVYSEYRVFFCKYKTQGAAAYPISSEGFWVRTSEIFPVIGLSRSSFQEKSIKLAVPQEAFHSVNLRKVYHVSGSKNPEKDEILREKMIDVPKTTVNQHYSLILLTPLQFM